MNLRRTWHSSQPKTSLRLFALRSVMRPAAARVLDEWKDFNQTSPLVLFLDRLTDLMLEYVQTDGAIEHRVMKRQRKIPTGSPNGSKGYPSIAAKP
jgi:hypothetical protein